MTPGPLEYLVVGFEGNHFSGQILSEPRPAREKGIIRIVDLSVAWCPEGSFADVQLPHPTNDIEQQGDASVPTPRRRTACP